MKNVTNRGLERGFGVPAAHAANGAQENSNAAQTYFLHTDMVGSVRAITDSAGQVVARFEYEPFGLLSMSSGSAASGAHRFTGKPQDSGTGLYYFGARYHDAQAGRFISRDPAKDGLNWFEYCRNNPTRFVDPTGLYIPMEGEPGHNEFSITPDPNSISGYHIHTGGNRFRNPVELAEANYQFTGDPKWLNPVAKILDWPASTSLSLNLECAVSSAEKFSLGIYSVSLGITEVWVGCGQTINARTPGGAKIGIATMTNGVWAFGLGIGELAAAATRQPSPLEQIADALPGAIGQAAKYLPGPIEITKFLCALRLNNVLNEENTRR